MYLKMAVISRSVLWLQALMALIAIAQASRDNNRGRCQSRFAKLCIGPCGTQNLTGPLNRYNCLANCFESFAANMTGCPPPSVPRFEFKKLNCSDVEQVRCESCRNTTGLVRAECIIGCARNKSQSFRDCKHNQHEFPGDDDDRENCTLKIRSKCEKCFKSKLTMEDKLRCLGDCVRESAVDSDRECTRNVTIPVVPSNCTDILDQCLECTRVIGIDNLKCLKDCNATKRFRGQCTLEGTFPGFIFPHGPCAEAIKQNCATCVTTGGELRDSLSCLKDCVENQRPCKPTRGIKECTEQLCKPTCESFTGSRRGFCYARCAFENAAALQACVAGSV
jgi:hypothetical protein